MNWKPDLTGSVLSLRHLGRCECFLDVLFDLTPCLQTKRFIHEFAVATNVERGRQERQAAVSVTYRALANQNRVRWVSASLTQPLQIVVSGWF
jgi:hypothetical protein